MVNENYLSGEIFMDGEINRRTDATGTLRN
jgi:hypothetical protein